jgi:DNA-binding transcriptional ArsR family regulator
MKNNTECYLKALANKRRLAIVKFLSKEKRSTVGNIAGHIKLSLKATSKHLIILSSVDIVDHEQEGLSMLYKLNPAHPILKSVLQYV